jgi:hypothetical protein
MKAFGFVLIVLGAVLLATAGHQRTEGAECQLIGGDVLTRIGLPDRGAEARAKQEGQA